MLPGPIITGMKFGRALNRLTSDRAATRPMCHHASIVTGDAPGLVAGEQTGSRPSARFILEINAGQRLAVGVADDEALRGP